MSPYWVARRAPRAPGGVPTCWSVWSSTGRSGPSPQWGYYSRWHVVRQTHSTHHQLAEDTRRQTNSGDRTCSTGHFSGPRAPPTPIGNRAERTWTPPRLIYGYVRQQLPGALHMEYMDNCTIPVQGYGTHVTPGPKGERAGAARFLSGTGASWTHDNGTLLPSTKLQPIYANGPTLHQGLPSDACQTARTSKDQPRTLGGT